MHALAGLDVELRELLAPDQTRVSGGLENDYWLDRLGKNPIEDGCVTGLCRGAMTRVSDFSVGTD